jgi:hypothetical protein
MTLSDYGVFADIVGVVLTGASAVATIAVTWRGKIERWQPPQEVLPQGARNVATVLSFIGIALCWLNVDSTNWKLSQLWGVALAIALVVFFAAYYAVFDWRCFTLVEPGKKAKPVKRKIVGGFWLTPQARSLVVRGKSEKALLYESAGNIEGIWPRASLTVARTTLALLFIGVMTTGTVGMTAWGAIVVAKAKAAPAPLPPAPRPDPLPPKPTPPTSYEESHDVIYPNARFHITLDHRAGDVGNYGGNPVRFHGEAALEHKRAEGILQVNLWMFVKEQPGNHSDGTLYEGKESYVLLKNLPSDAEITYPIITSETATFDHISPRPTGGYPAGDANMEGRPNELVSRWIFDGTPNQTSPFGEAQMTAVRVKIKSSHPLAPTVTALKQ